MICIGHRVFAPRHILVSDLLDWLGVPGARLRRRRATARGSAVVSEFDSAASRAARQRQFGCDLVIAFTHQSFADAVSSHVAECADDEHIHAFDTHRDAHVAYNWRPYGNSDDRPNHSDSFG